MTLHENSKASYLEERTKGRTESFRKKIYQTLKEYPAQGMTGKMLMQALNESDVNNIRPEITRLKDDGLIVEIGKVKCEWTHKTVSVFSLTQKPYAPRQRGIKEDLF